MTHGAIMDVTKLSEKLMLMNDNSWQRHSNPWSVYSRFSILPLISLAFWSREWIGTYFVFPIILSFLWIWLNPRVFGVPRTTNNWASMGTFGERIYLNRKTKAIPEHHVKSAFVLQLLSGLGLPIFIYGLYSLKIWALISGNIWVMAFKAWFVDRMVWLYMEMKDSDPKYGSWVKS
jgi:uncharacterized protein DUF6653